MMGGSWVLVWIKERTQILSQTLPLQFYAMLHGEKKKKSYWTFSSSSIFSPTSWVITKSKTKQNTPNVHVHAVLWRCKILYVVLGYHFSKNKQTNETQPTVLQTFKLRSQITVMMMNTVHHSICSWQRKLTFSPPAMTTDRSCCNSSPRNPRHCWSNFYLQYLLAFLRCIRSIKGQWVLHGICNLR